MSDTTAVNEAAAASAKERLKQIKLQGHLEIAFMEGVIWAKEHELERLQAISKEVNQAISKEATNAQP